MPVSREDSAVVCSNKADKMCEEYEKRFGKSFPSFNYRDFPMTPEKTASALYMERLQKCLDDNEPLDESLLYVYGEDEW